jgi:non-ribosomal peptide synthetase component F
VLVVEPGTGLSFAELVSRTHRHVMQALGHQQMPLELPARKLSGRNRDVTRNALFDASLSYRWDDAQALSFPGCRVCSAHAGAGGAKFDLALSCVREVDGLRARWEYRSGLSGRRPSIDWLGSSSRCSRRRSPIHRSRWDRF